MPLIILGDDIIGQELNADKTEFLPFEFNECHHFMFTLNLFMCKRNPCIIGSLPYIKVELMLDKSLGANWWKHHHTHGPFHQLCYLPRGHASTLFSPDMPSKSERKIVCHIRSSLYNTEGLRITERLMNRLWLYDNKWWVYVLFLFHIKCINNKCYIILHNLYDWAYLHNSADGLYLNTWLLGN